jgi:uncharacterized protein
MRRALLFLGIASGCIRSVICGARRAIALGVPLLVSTCASVGVSLADPLTSDDSISEYRRQLNDSVVTIVAGPLNGTGLSIASDLATVLGSEQLRVVPILGSGVAQNVKDVRFLRGVDLGITQANVLTYFAKTGELGPNLTSEITYIAKLFNEEVHIVARREVRDIRELSGEVVSFGERGSGAEMTAKLIFEGLGVDVKPIHSDNSEALLKVRSGEIKAAVIIGGQPVPSLMEQAEGLTLLSIPYSAELEDDYYPATVSHDDYPQLMAAGREVETVSVCAVLVTFNWAEDDARYNKVAKFVDAFFSRFEEFHQEPHHPKWRDVNFAATLENWTRSPIAQKWIDKTARKVAPSRAQFEEFMRASGADTEMAVGERSALFRAFLEWNQTRGVAAKSSN